MITVEMDWDETAITVLDPEGKNEDLQVYLYDDVVYIRQWFEEAGRHQVLQVSPIQFASMISAMKLPDGAYVIDKEQYR